MGAGSFGWGLTSLNYIDLFTETAVRELHGHVENRLCHGLALNTGSPRTQGGTQELMRIIGEGIQDSVYKL